MANETGAIPDTALRQDYAFKAVDDYDTRMYILPYLTDKENREKIIAEHKANPRFAATQPGYPAPIYSQPLARLIDKLRVIPQTGKHIIVETKPWKEYTIAILPGVRGGTVQLTGKKYPTREEADHAIFLKRLGKLLEAYGIETWPANS
jgi:hypothetical protein